jgi:hypothetical protein
MPKPRDAAGAGGAAGCDFRAAKAAPGPANAASAAIAATTAAPLFNEILFAISPSLSVDALRANRSH